MLYAKEMTVLNLKPIIDFRDMSTAFQEPCRIFQWIHFI